MFFGVPAVPITVVSSERLGTYPATHRLWIFRSQQSTPPVPGS